jgi:hypothetical protein
MKEQVMAELKYKKNFVTLPKPNCRKPCDRPDEPTPDMYTRVMFTDAEYPTGAFYLDCNWFWKGSEMHVRAKQHSHDFDEILAFFGSNPENPQDLCGEIELWIEDEKYILTESCVVFVPKGTKHCPLIIRRVNRPIFEFTTGPSGAGVKK